MKLLRMILTLFFTISVSSLFAGSFASSIGQGDLVIYFPSVNLLQTLSGELLARFYGPNFTQVLEDIKLRSRETVGLSIYSDQELSAAGVDIGKPVAFVHHSGNKGYLMLSLASEQKFRDFHKKNLSAGLIIRSGVAFLSAQTEVLAAITNSLMQDKSFAHALRQKGYAWDKPMIWMNGRYLAEMAGGEGVTTHLDIPGGFSFITVHSVSDKLHLDFYSGAFDNSVLKYMRSMSDGGGKGDFDVLDFAWGNPAVIGHARLHLPSLYNYLVSMDRLNITGFHDIVDRWKKDYGLDVYTDLLQNADGRIKLVVNTFDDKKKKYNFYGSLGIKNKTVSRRFMESLKMAILKSGAKLYSFEMFTHPVFHYKYKDIDLYFGTIEQDFFIASHKETLIKVVKNIFEERIGNLDNLHPVVKDASQKNSVGYYYQLDVQALLSGIKTSGFIFNADLLTGIKDVLIYGYPDSGSLPYGWNTRVTINYYK